jgi:Uma2 family endonuclease
MTIREYRLLPEDGKRWELVHGEFVMTPAPSTRHQKVSRKLQYELMTQLEKTGLAEVMNAPVDVVFDDLNVVQPDLVVVASARSAIITARAVEGPPDVLVEILSPSSVDRDRHLKRALYAHFGVREYWIVDPARGFLEAYRLAEGGYQLRERHDRAATLRCPDFPLLEVPLLEVFT